MKKLLLILSLTIFTVGYSSAKKTNSSEAAKQELKANVDKDSKKLAKSLTKEGWKSLPGRVPLEKQIERSKVAELSLDAMGNRVYILGSHKAVGGNYSAAKNIATVRAKGELTSNMKAHIKQTIMDKNSNKQIDQSEIELLNETISATVESVDLDIAGVNNLLEIYRDVDGGKCEIMVTLSIKSNEVSDQIIGKVSKRMAKKLSKLKF